MIKSFREILAEKDDEYTYYVRSTADIHCPELFERIRLSLLPYDIMSFECDTYKPIEKSNKYFPDEPNSPCYSLKLVTGLKVPKEFIGSLAMDAHIHVSHLRIDGDQDVELVNQWGEVAGGQSLVGTQRIAAFIKELQADRKKRDGDTIEREVYESFCTTHRGIEDLVKKPVRKGYYVVEAFSEEGKNYLKAQGPISDRPQFEYHDRIPGTAHLVTESTTGDTYSVHILMEV